MNRHSLRPAALVVSLYLALTAIPLAAGGLGGVRLLAMVAHLGALAAVVLCDLRRNAGAAGVATRAFADLHLLVLLPALYAELPMLMEGMPGPVVYHDPVIQRIEAALFGGQPSFELAGAVPSVLLSETVHLAYLLYYAIIYVPPLVVYGLYHKGYKARRRETETGGAGGLRSESSGAAESSGPGGLGWERSVAAESGNIGSRATGSNAAGSFAASGAANPSVRDSEGALPADKVMLTMTLAMLPCFLAFVLWPVQGPRYLGVPDGAPDGPIRSLTLSLLQTGSSRGAAFPSSHVSLAVAQALVMLRIRRRFGVVLAVAGALLALGAVYGGFHYVVDTLAGAVVGVLAAWTARRWTRRTSVLPAGFAPASV